MRHQRIFFIIPLLLLLTGCATSNKRLGGLETKVNVLESRVNLVEGRQSNIEDQSGESRESMGYLKGRVENVSHGPSTVVIADVQGNKGDIYKSGKISFTKKKIQVALKNAGFYNGPIDGKIGKNTKQAIKEFQKANGLSTDGIVGPKTKALLVQYLNQQSDDKK